MTVPAPIPAIAMLDPALCRTMAKVVRRLDLTFDDKERIAEQLTAAADLADRKPLTEEQVRKVVREACAGLLGGMTIGVYGDGPLDGDGMRNMFDAIATRAAKELAGAVIAEVPANPFCGVRGCPGGQHHAHDPADWTADGAADPAQRDADLREAFLAGFERCRQDGRLTAAVADDAAEYARSKAGVRWPPS